MIAYDCDQYEVVRSAMNIYPPLAFARSIAWPVPALTLCLSAALCLAMVGCDDSTVRSYEAPKPAQPPLVVGPDGSGRNLADGDQAQNQGPVAHLHWHTPDAWQVVSAVDMAVAAWRMPADDMDDGTGNGASDKSPLVTVSRLRGDGGGAMMNINRWRRQTQLPPIGSLDDSGATAMTLPGMADKAQGLRVQLVTDSRSIVGLILPGPTNVQTWFVKLDYAGRITDRQLAAFDQWVAAMEFHAQEHES